MRVIGSIILTLWEGMNDKIGMFRVSLVRQCKDACERNSLLTFEVLLEVELEMEIPGNKIHRNIGKGKIIDRTATKKSSDVRTGSPISFNAFF